jgi:hypothetical protein
MTRSRRTSDTRRLHALHHPASSIPSSVQAAQGNTITTLPFALRHPSSSTTHTISSVAAMSFDRSPALESQPTAWRREDDPQYADDPEFRRFTQELSDKLFSLTSNVSRLSSEVGLLGTKRETERVRERVRTLIDEGNSGFKEVGEGLKRVLSWEDVGVGLTVLFTSE